MGGRLGLIWLNFLKIRARASHPHISTPARNPLHGVWHGVTGLESPPMNTPDRFDSAAAASGQRACVRISPITTTTQKG